MGRFLDTRGEQVLSPYICDRCRMIKAFSEMQEDEDRQGLWVCKGCSDQLDPWKLPPRESEDVTIPHPRPDTELADFTALTDERGNILTDQQGTILTP